MRFGAYETAPQRVHTATGLGLVLPLVLLSCSSRTAFRSGRFSFGHEWVGEGGNSLSFTGVLGQSNRQESHTYRNRFGKTCLFSSGIGPALIYNIGQHSPRLRVSCPFYDNEASAQPSSEPYAESLCDLVRWPYPRDDEACSRIAHLCLSYPKHLHQTTSP